MRGQASASLATLAPWAVIASVLLATAQSLGARAAANTPSADAAATPETTLVLPAEVIAYQSVLLTAKVAGYLKRITVDKGDKVKAGELIAELEVPELLADQIRDRARVDVARRVYERMQKASKTAPDLVTPDDLDNSRGQFEVAQAELDRVQALLAYARVTAPFSGTVTARHVDAGAFIPVPSESAQTSAAIVTLMDFSHIRVQMWVPEIDAHRIRPGCKAVFTAVALPGQHFAATITRVSYALERNARTMLAEIDMANPGEVLQPGMYLSVKLILESEVSGS
ncbi:MAG TPA: efflux RND transporter periplasmic adaptor subunit [Steroidobacteraceae bacterium]|nr:efflux RND transporter periplasmic adaptor subunit [Steroidobacteraceae bacterium]